MSLYNHPHPFLVGDETINNEWFNHLINKYAKCSVVWALSGGEVWSSGEASWHCHYGLNENGDFILIYIFKNDTIDKNINQNKIMWTDNGKNFALSLTHNAAKDSNHMEMFNDAGEQSICCYY